MPFKKVRHSPYQDQNCELIEFVHESGLRHFHLTSDFPEQVFALSVPTPPVDDTGMPHVLEHLTLCGGSKYPVRNPFMAMQSRSVAHDMNASTAQLHTTYHFSTSHDKDFGNMADLYLDLVFCPLLRETDFEQEGWRLERDEQNALSLKGVVFNEMKGSYAEPSRAQILSLFALLAPNTPLDKSSGGHPAAIPSLTHDRLTSFYLDNYTPSKAVLVTSGHVDMARLHQQVEETLVRRQQVWPNPSSGSHLSPPPKGALFPQQTSKSEDLDGAIRVPYPGEETAAHHASWVWTASLPSNPREELFDQMMAEAAFGSQTSDLSQIIEQSGKGSLGSGYIFDPLKTAAGKVGLMIKISGLEPSDLSAMQEHVYAAWERVAEKGIDPDRWVGTVASFRAQICSGIGESPRSIVLGIASNAVEGSDPLDNSDNINHLNYLASNPPSLEEVRTWCARFQANPVLSLHNAPDPKLIASWNDVEQTRLDDLEINSTSAFEQKLRDKTQQQLLARAQTGDISTLPTLIESDLAEPNTTPVARNHQPAGVNHCAATHFSASTTMGHIDLSWDVGSLSPDDIFFLTQWCAIVPHLGTRDQTSLKQKTWEEERGVDIGWSLSPMSRVNQDAGLLLVCSAASLTEQINYTAEALLDRTAGAPQPEFEKFKFVITQLQEAKKKDPARRHYQEAKLSAQAPFSNKNALLYYVMTQKHKMEDQWLEDVKADPQKAYKEFSRIFKAIQTCPRHVTSIGNQDVMASAQKLSKAWPGGASWNNLSDWTPIVVTRPSPSTAQTQSPVLVHHCIQVQPGPLFSSPDFMATKVLLNLLEPTLHQTVREVGGAYGSDASSRSGMMSWSSFRDPHVVETFSAFNNVQSFDLAGKNWTEQDLFAAKLTVFKTLTAPQSSREQAMQEADNSFSGLSWDYLHAEMKKLAAVTFVDVEQAQKRWLSPAADLISRQAIVPHGSDVDWTAVDPGGVIAPARRKTGLS